MFKTALNLTKRDSLLSAAGFVLMAGSPLAYAEQLAATDQVAASQQGGVEEIIVTARKVKENIQDVPVSITALSQTFLEDNNITRIDDVARQVPGFSINDNGQRSISRPFIRGISTTSVEFYQQKVKTFLDGVLIAGTTVTSIPFSELEQVEVLKGPQATAFGRGVLAGAVGYTTKEPTDEFTGTVSAEARSHDEEAVNAFISGPLVPGLLKGYLNVRDYHYGGPGIVNSYDGSQMGGESTKYISAKLVYTPVDWLTAKLYGSYGQDKDGLPINQAQPLSARTDISTPQSLAITGGVHTFAALGEVTAGGAQTYYPDNEIGSLGLKREYYRSALHVSADLDFATLTSISAYNQSHEVQASQLNGGMQQRTSTGAFLPGFGGSTFFSSVEPFPIPACNQYVSSTCPTRDYAQYLIRQVYKDAQQEFRLTSNSTGPLAWMAGVNYINYWQYENYQTFPSYSVYRTNSYSFYGSLKYTWDDFVFTAEGRYNVDHQGQNSYGFGNFPHVADFYRFLPRVSVDYHITPDVSAYATFSEGNSPGFFGGSSLVQGSPGERVNEELLYNYEVGLKSRWLDRQVQADLSVYQEDYKNQQLLSYLTIPNAAAATNPLAPALTTLPVYLNAPGAKARGLEFELAAAPQAIPGLKLRGSMAYVHAVYTSYCSAQQYTLTPTPPPAGVIGTGFNILSYNGCAQVAGKFLPGQPEYQGSMSATYKRPISDTWTALTSADWTYVGRKFGSETNIAWTPPSEIVNLHAGVQSDNVKIDFFVLNATGEDAPTYVSTGNAGFLNPAANGTTNNHFTSILNTFTPQKPRQFGLLVSYTW